MEIVKTNQQQTKQTAKLFINSSYHQYQKILETLSRNDAIDIFISHHMGADSICIYDLFSLSKTALRIFFLGNPDLIDTVILSAGTAGRYVLPHTVLNIRPLAAKYDFARTNLFLEANVRSVCENAVNTNHKLANILAQVTGKTLAEIQDRMNNNPYFTAEEAVAFGLIDGVVTDLSMMMGTAES